MPNASLVTTSQLPNAIDRRFRKSFLDEYPTVEPMLTKIFKIQTQEDKNEYEQDMKGLGQYELTSEAEKYKEDAVGEAFQTIYTPFKFTKNVSVSYEAQKWDKTAVTSAGYLGRDMARAAADTIETKAASVFNNATNASYTSYGDAKALGATDHTRPDGGTAQSNLITTAFEDETLEDAIILLRQQKNNRGRLIKARPRTLLIPPEIEKQALVVTKSILRSDTGDNATNAYNMREYSGSGLNVVVWDYLGVAAGGAADNWFLLDNDLHKVTFKWAEKPMVEKDDTTGKQNGTIAWLGMTYFSYGWSDWRGVVVANPA